jgi:hypothetical protein
MARQQPYEWIPHLYSLRPGFKTAKSSDGTDQIKGAIYGDLAAHEGGLSMFNGREWQDARGLSRCSLLDRFALRPQLNADVLTALPIKKIISADCEYSFTEGTIDKRFFTADRALIITGARCTPSVADGEAKTAVITKLTSTEDFAAGDDCTAAFDLNATAHTVQDAALEATANITMAAGDSLAFEIRTGSTNLAAGEGIISVELEEVTGVSVAAAGVNQNFQVEGTNMTSALATYAPAGGVRLTTAGASADQALLWPHEDSNISAWNAIQWYAQHATIFQTQFNLPALIKRILFAGLFLDFAATWTKEDDNDKLCIWFDDDVDDYMHYTYSIAGTDVSGILTDVNGVKLTVVADTEYAVTMGTDQNSYPYIIVNGVLYFVGATALTASTALKPGIGVEANDTAAINLDCRYLAASRNF